VTGLGCRCSLASRRTIAASSPARCP
jgi:hypothetical protein